MKNRVDILLVEDDIELSEEVTEMLVAQGYSVECARTRYQYDRNAKSRSFSLYIVDLLLPDGHGHDIIRKIRERGRAGVVVLSGKVEELDKVVALELGADDYVEKPIARTEFLARIKSLIRRLACPEPTNAGPMSDGSRTLFGGWLTDFATRKLYAPCKAEVQLTKLEFELWVALLSAKDRVLTRDNLIHAIRGGDWAGNDRSIDGLVSRLRRKMGAYHDVDQLLETSRGVGYMLRSPPSGPAHQS